jgi:ankyrin repeat protein
MSTALFDAIEGRDVDRISALLAAGADPNAVQPEHPHFTALEAAIDILEEGGPIDSLILLLRAGASVNHRDEARGASPLLMAVFREQLLAVRILLGAGADPNVQDGEGDSPLRFCAERGWCEMARLLLQCGAAATIHEPGGLTGMNALGFAAVRLHADMVRLLLAYGAQPGAPDGDRLSALDRLRYVAEPGDAESRARLLEIRALLGAPEAST